MARDVKVICKWLRFGSRCYEPLCPPRQTKQKSWLLSWGKRAGMTRGCLSCTWPTLTLNSDTSTVSCGLQTTPASIPRVVNRRSSKLQSRLGIESGKTEAKQCVYVEFYVWNVSQAQLPRNLVLPDPETQSIMETQGSVAATAMAELHRGRLYSKSLTRIISF